MKVTKLEDGITDEMLEFFKERTRKHIELVQKYARKIVELDPERWAELAEQVEEHDASKLKSPELLPYVWVTWKHKCEDDGVDFDPPEGIEEMMDEATAHHIRSNRHHPECHCGPLPKGEKADGAKMSETDVAEMVADWCAMGEEKGNSPKDWADKNVDVKWSFDDWQVDLVYELIEEIWGD
jgi:hypothetical protein